MAAAHGRTSENAAAGWKRRWPLYALSAAATLAVFFAAEYGCWVLIAQGHS
jgi:hypothetical protein